MGAAPARVLHDAISSGVYAGLGGATRLVERAADAGLLRRRFIEEVGYGPKTLQRILRCQRAVAELRADRARLAGAAARAGYADQAHVSCESCRLAGLSPRELASWIG